MIAFHPGEGNDFVDGGSETDILSGENGDDRIYGRDGNDLILGDVDDANGITRRRFDRIF